MEPTSIITATASLITTMAQKALDPLFKIFASIVGLCWVSGIREGRTPIDSIHRLLLWLGIDRWEWLDSVGAWMAKRAEPIGLLASVMLLLSVVMLYGKHDTDSRAASTAVLAAVVLAQTGQITWATAMWSVAIPVMICLAILLVTSLLHIRWNPFAYIDGNDVTMVIVNIALALVSVVIPALWCVTSQRNDRERGSRSVPVHVEIQKTMGRAAQES